MVVLNLKVNVVPLVAWGTRSDSKFAGLSESVAASGIAASFVILNTGNSVAADLVSDIDTATKASLSRVQTTAAWEVGVLTEGVDTSRGISSNLMLVEWSLKWHGVNLFAASVISDAVLVFTLSSNAISINITWARDVQTLKSVDGAALLCTRVIHVTSVTATVSLVVVTGSNESCHNTAGS